MHLTTRRLVASLPFLVLAPPYALGQSIIGSSPISNAISPAAEPNATAIVPIPGYRLHEFYPGRPVEASRSGWTLQYNITESARRYPDDKDYTYFDIDLRPPTSVPEALYFPKGDFMVPQEIADTWLITGVCLGFQDEAGFDENRPDGSCQDILSEQCRTDFSNSILQSDRALNGNLSSSTLSVIKNASPSCPWGRYSHMKCKSAPRRLQGSETDQARKAIPLNENFTVNSTNRWGIGELKSRKGDYDNAYDEFGGRTLPFAFLFGHSNTTTIGEAPSRDHLVFACIKATDAVGDSRLPSSALRRSRTPGNAWAVSLACLLAAIAMF